MGLPWFAQTRVYPYTPKPIEVQSFITVDHPEKNDNFGVQDTAISFEVAVTHGWQFKAR
jgi:hypothetical protein